MLSFLYEVFIYPLEWCMSLIYELAYYPEGSAIILLSIVVNILLLPIYNVFERWQIEDRAKQKSMDAMLSMIKRSFSGQQKFIMIKTLYRQNNYNTLHSLRNSLGFFFQIPFFIAAYAFLSKNPDLTGADFYIFKDLSQPDNLFKIGDFYINFLPILMTVISLLSVYIYSKDLLKSEKKQLFVLPIIFLVILYNSPSGLVLYWTLNNVFSIIKNYVLHLRSPKVFPHSNTNGLVYYLAVFNVIFLIALYFPIKIYLSDIGFIKLDIYQFVVETSQLIVVVLAVFAYIRLVFPTEHQNLLVKLILIVSLSMSTYAAYNFFDTGILDGFTITNIQNLAKSKYYIILIDGLILLSIILCIFFVKNLKIFNYLFVSSILSITMISGYMLFANPISLRVIKHDGRDSSKLPIVPDYAEDLLSFSKTEKNIVVIMADSFEGQHMSTILNFHPEIKEQLRGFVWYENTISQGGRTFFGEPAIHGGHNFTPFAINDRSDQIISLTDEIAKSYTTFITEFSRKGFDVQILGPSYTTCEKINHYTNKEARLCKDYSYQEDFINYFLQKNNISNISNSFQVTRFLEALALYNVVPYSLRNLIYNNASWLNTVKLNESVVFDYKNYAFISSMADLSSVSDRPPSLKYISTEYTHPTWMIYPDCQTIKEQNKIPKNMNNYNNDGLLTEQLIVETCFLQTMSRWFNWLKTENIFDNTMIVIVSDHGAYNDLKLAQTVGADLKTVADLPNSALKLPYPGNPGALLLIKDFNNNNDFAVDNEYLMSNADTLAIVCAKTGGCTNIEEDPRKLKNENRALRHMWSKYANPDRHALKKYEIDVEFEVKGNIYVKENWRQITPE